MAAVLFLVLFAGIASGSHIRYPRDSSGSTSSGGAGAFSSASSFSSSGTKVDPGPGGYGNFNAFAGTSNFGIPPFGFGGGSPSLRGPDQAFSGGYGGGFGGSGNSNFPGMSPTPFGGFPGFSPFVPQFGQQYPFTPFPTFPAPFDFMSFLNQYFQSIKKFQAQAEAQAHQAAASGGTPTDTNEVGGTAFATYSPQGGYGSANIFPKPEGGLETRFGENESPQNSVSGGPVYSASGNLQPPQGSRFGVFTSSSSGSSDINGKKTSFKQSSVTVDDNGKVTTYSAHDP